MKIVKGMKREFSELSNRVIGCAIEAHRVIGPGLLESTYERRFEELYLMTLHALHDLHGKGSLSHI